MPDTSKTRRHEVRTTGLRTAATMANCDTCEWTCHSHDGGMRERSRVRAASRRHAETTGHDVWIDIAMMDRYVVVR